MCARVKNLLSAKKENCRDILVFFLVSHRFAKRIFLQKEEVDDRFNRLYVGDKST